MCDLCVVAASHYSNIIVISHCVDCQRVTARCNNPVMILTHINFIFLADLKTGVNFAMSKGNNPETPAQQKRKKKKKKRKYNR